MSESGVEPVGLTALSAEGFRNLAPFRMLPGPRFNLLEGRNGQGKTNVLEAIYLLSAFKSSRDARQTEMIQLGSSRAWVRGEITRRGVERVIEVGLSAEGKRVSLDGKVITRLPASFAHLAAVVFGPDDLELAKAGPEVRRRFLDRATFAVWPEHLQELRAYQEALKHRNRLLRDAKGRGGGLDADVMEAFEGELARRGAAVLMRRHLFLERLIPLFYEAFERVTGGELTATLVHRVGTPAGVALDLVEREGLEATLRAGLKLQRSSDVRLGWTRLGPHADDLELAIDGKAARVFASQGQQRALVLALKIAELQRIYEAHGVYPVFLLDDVSSELDERRNALLMETLERGGGQVFVTTTDRRWIRISEGAMRAFRVDGGVISEM